MVLATQAGSLLGGPAQLAIRAPAHDRSPWLGCLAAKCWVLIGSTRTQSAEREQFQAVLEEATGQHLDLALEVPELISVTFYCQGSH